MVFDVRESGKFPDLHKLHIQLENMTKALNRKFSKYFPENDLSVKGRFEKGFSPLHLGDCSWAGINNAEIVLEIIKYQQEKYPSIPLWWIVAKDGYTEKDWINIQKSQL